MWEGRCVYESSGYDCIGDALVDALLKVGAVDVELAKLIEGWQFEKRSEEW